MWWFSQERSLDNVHTFVFEKVIFFTKVWGYMLVRSLYSPRHQNIEMTLYSTYYRVFLEYMTQK